MKLIAVFSLNLSLAIYLVWFIPQIWLNFKRKDTEGLSLFMHGLLCLGYLTDLLYGFGRGMQWQYRTVTLTGLVSLAVQHYQFGRYGLHRITQKYMYVALTFLLLILIFIIFYVFHLNSDRKIFYDNAGMVANICWFIYMLPQIIKNRVNHSAQGLSALFILLGILSNLCDITSAWILGWDFPSKIGPPITLIGNLILLSQIIYYKKQAIISA